ncbi:PAC2 family protein [Dehalococcoidia bacterium]|nr:PAC2 family protein [Dehalococcoidia bacterium]
MIQEQSARIPGKRGAGNPTLIVAWSHDAGGIASSVIQFLDKKLGLEPFGEIEPVGFFSLDGVRIEDNLIQFPESRFFSPSSADNIIILYSDAPSLDHYRFLNTILDFARDNFKVKELYTVGGIVSASAHLSPRRVFAVVNRRELKGELAPYGVELDVDYRTPAGSMPTLSSFLLWVARRRGIPGCGLWVNVPFYLSALADPIASKCILEVLDQKFELGLDFRELDLEIAKLNEDLEQLMRRDPDLSRHIQMLERGIALSEDEGEKLAQEVAKFFLTKAPG